MRGTPLSGCAKATWTRRDFPGPCSQRLNSGSMSPKHTVYSNPLGYSEHLPAHLTLKGREQIPKENQGQGHGDRGAVSSEPKEGLSEGKGLLRRRRASSLGPVWCGSQPLTRTSGQGDVNTQWGVRTPLLCSPGSFRCSRTVGRGKTGENHPM